MYRREGKAAIADALNLFLQWTGSREKLLLALYPQEIILIAAREIEKTRTELFRIIAEHTGQPLERVAADGDRDFWMTAEEAKAYGMVDEILYKKSK